jgi:hypothetical protein
MNESPGERCPGFFFWGYSVLRLLRIGPAGLASNPDPDLDLLTTTGGAYSSLLGGGLSEFRMYLAIPQEPSGCR